MTTLALLPGQIPAANMITAVALVGLLVVRELAGGRRGQELRHLRRSLILAIAPLGIIFAVAVVCSI